MVACGKCGKKMKRAYKHCPSCGFSIAAQSHAKAVARFASQDIKDQIMWKNAPTRIKGPMKILLAILIILLILSLVIVVL